MKKIILIIVLSVAVLCGCSNSKIYSYAKDNIAESRQSLFVGGNDKIDVSFVTGQREKDYVVNGYCTESIEFGVLTFTIKSEVVMPDTVNYVLTVGTTRYDGVLEVNPYNSTYVCDIKKLIGSDSVITAKIIAGEFVENVELTNITNNWNVDYINALKLACSELDKELLKLVEDDTFKAEVYIKIVNDEDVNNEYYWYVNFVGRNGKTYAVVIDPISNEILAKR